MFCFMEADLTARKCDHHKSRQMNQKRYSYWNFIILSEYYYDNCGQYILLLLGDIL